MSFFAIGQWFLKDIPALQVGHALGLFIYAFGIIVVVMLAASLRTNVIVVVALALLIGVFFCLGAGNYGVHLTLIHRGGYLGLAAAACAFYLGLTELCEFSYGRSVLPVWPPAPSLTSATSTSETDRFGRWLWWAVMITCTGSGERTRKGFGEPLARRSIGIVLPTRSSTGR
jgi:hypothetical protein